MNDFGCLINYGLKSVAWVTLSCADSDKVKPMARSRKMGLLEHSHLQLKLLCPDNFGKWERIDLRHAFDLREQKLKVRGDQQ